MVIAVKASEPIRTVFNTCQICFASQDITGKPAQSLFARTAATGLAWTRPGSPMKPVADF